MAVDCGMPALLDFRHVTVSRGGSRNASVPALDDVSLRIEQGEHVCILGPNGCGKSTLIKTITRELYPLQGRGPLYRFWGGNVGISSSCEICWE